MSDQPVGALRRRTGAALQWAADASLGKRRRTTIPAGAVLAALALLVVPSAFDVFPELAEWRLRYRAAIGAILLVLAVVGTRRALRREAESDTRTLEGRRREAHQFRLARNRLLGRLVRPAASGLPDHYDLTVYLLDPQQHLLVPIYPAWNHPGDDVRAFAPGRGATGQAFQRDWDGTWEPDSVMLVTGDAVSDDTWGLSAEQRELWRDYTVVASTTFTVGEKLLPAGVVTAISKTDDCLFETDEGAAALVRLAHDLGSLLFVTTDPDAIGAS